MSDAPSARPSIASDASAFTAEDAQWMTLALELAAKGRGDTSPNPMVGCVLVRAGQVLGMGFHPKAGEGHAEVWAIRDAKAQGHILEGATAYVTLEPCCHYGRTGPCSQALIAEKVARVVIAQRDPNPKVNGGGEAQLKTAGIEVVSGLFEDKARHLNRIFNRWVSTQTPYVTLKLAMSLDGRISAHPNQRTPVTGPLALAEVMALRAEHDLTLVGSETARVDNPRLDVREPQPQPKRLPWRGALDRRLTLPLEARLFSLPHALLITSSHHPESALAPYRDKGVRICQTAETNGRLDVGQALDALAQDSAQPICSVLVEGGGQLAADLLAHDRIDRLVLHLAPHLFGSQGVAALGPLAEPLRDRFTLSEVRHLGADLALDYARSPKQDT